MASASGESAVRQGRIKASHGNASLSFLITNPSVVHTKKPRERIPMFSFLCSETHGISDILSKKAHVRFLSYLQ